MLQLDFTAPKPVTTEGSAEASPSPAAKFFSEKKAGGKVEQGESPQLALAREIREELGVEIRADNLLLTVEHEYDTKLVTLYLFQCALLKGMPRALEGQEIRWIKLADLPNYSFPPPDKKIIEFLGSLKNPDILPIPG